MHELSVAMALYRACRTEIDARGGGKLLIARAAIGELAGVEAPLLEHAWPMVVVDTLDEDAALQIQTHAAEQICPSCGVIRERQPGTWLRLCPFCLGPLRVSDASQLEIIGIEFVPVADSAAV